MTYTKEERRLYQREYRAANKERETQRQHDNYISNRDVRKERMKVRYHTLKKGIAEKYYYQSDPVTSIKKLYT